MSEYIFTRIKFMTDLNMYTRGSIYWYENPFTDKNDYGKPDKNQDVLTNRPVLIIEDAKDTDLFTLNSVMIVTISTSERRLGIPINMNTNYNCKILPYSITTVKKIYLNEYKGHISAKLMEEVFQAIDYHTGRTSDIPKYILDAMKTMKKNPDVNAHFDVLDNEKDIPAIQNVDNKTLNKLPAVKNTKINKSSISLNEKYTVIYDSLHPYEKARLHKMSISEITTFFSKINMSWGTAKKLKMKIAGEINALGYWQYCIKHLKERIGDKTFNKYISGKDAGLFLECHDNSLIKTYNLDQTDIDAYKTKFSSEIIFPQYYEEDQLKIFVTEKI